jgi:uncharacterized protein
MTIRTDPVDHVDPTATLSTMPPMPSGGPPAFHLLAKPTGATCNIDCTYCFFLSKEALYPNEKTRMSEATLDVYIRTGDLPPDPTMNRSQHSQIPT